MFLNGFKLSDLRDKKTLLNGEKTVFITGTTVSMGGAGFKEFLQRRDRLNTL